MAANEEDYFARENMAFGTIAGLLTRADNVGVRHRGLFLFTFRKIDFLGSWWFWYLLRSCKTMGLEQIGRVREVGRY